MKKRVLSLSPLGTRVHTSSARFTTHLKHDDIEPRWLINPRAIYCARTSVSSLYEMSRNYRRCHCRRLFASFQKRDDLQSEQTESLLFAETLKYSRYRARYRRFSREVRIMIIYKMKFREIDRTDRMCAATRSPAT